MIGRRTELAKVRMSYERELPAEEVEQRQLSAFNEQWDRVTRTSAFYRHWKQHHRLPDRLRCLKDLSIFPHLTKAIIQEHLELVFAEGSLHSVYTTGGTTAEPTVFPRGGFESTGRWADNYVGRQWWGIQPTDRRVLIWGHSHLYGTGPARLARLVDRRVRDAMMKTTRLDGYRIDIESSREYLNEILRVRPTHVVGYSTALVRLAQAADQATAVALQGLRLKGLVATSETLHDHDRDMLSSVFGCPVIIEYGASEIGVVAVSRRASDNIRTLWQSHLLSNDAVHGVVVSALRRQQFPLIQYRLGDRVVVRDETADGSVLAVHRISGRTLDILRIGSSSGATTEISAFQLTHMIKGHPDVRNVQFSQLDDDRAGVHVHLRPGGSLADVAKFLRIQLRRDYPMVKTDRVEVIDEPEQLHSRSGKHLVVRPPPGAPPAGP